MPFKREEVARLFAARDVVMPDTFYDQLIGQAKVHAFTISSVAEITLLHEAAMSLEAAILAGTAISDWASAVPLALPDWHKRLVVQNAVNMARSRARELASREIAKQGGYGDRPHCQYLAVGDGATRQSHLFWHKIILPADDPFWDKHTPPNDHGCRCKKIWIDAPSGPVVSFEQEMATRELQFGERAAVGPGWDHNPGDIRQTVNSIFSSVPSPLHPLVDPLRQRRLGEIYQLIES